MCVEFCWCLCIHKVSFRGACYFFASVHSYDGVRRLLNLIFTHVLLRTYFMDSRKTDLDMEQEGEDEESIKLFAKSMYYLATTVTAFLIFRAVEKEWRQLMQWAGIVFMVIEALALSTFFLLHPDSYTSANCILTLSSRAVFVFFYMVSLALYIIQLSREEKESEWKFQQSEWEPRFLGKSPSQGFANLSGFGTLGFGENTLKWLEAEKVIPHPQLIDEYTFPALKKVSSFSSESKEKVGAGVITSGFDAKVGGGENDNSKFEVRYEVCKSTGKH